MEKIIWTDKYSVGVKDLDEQHEIIFELINSLSEQTNISVRSEQISSALSKMTAYFWEHFKIEEKYMKDYGFPEYERQVSQHLLFKKKVMNLCTDTMEYKNSVPEDLLLFLKKWWSNHILKEDMRYRSFFIEKGLR